MDNEKGRQTAHEAPEENVRRRANNQVASAHFAGRIGGNQEFVSESDSLLEEQPDAVSLCRYHNVNYH